MNAVLLLNILSKAFLLYEAGLRFKELQDQVKAMQKNQLSEAEINAFLDDTLEKAIENAQNAIDKNE